MVDWLDMICGLPVLGQNWTYDGQSQGPSLQHSTLVMCQTTNTDASDRNKGKLTVFALESAMLCEWLLRQH